MRQVTEITGLSEHSDQTNTDVLVREGGRLLQGGQVNGNVTVEHGAALEQRGQLNGDLHAYGRVVLTGQVNGEVHCYPGCELLIAEGVQIGQGSARRYVRSDGTFAPVSAQGTSVTRVGPNFFQLTPSGTLISAQ